MQRAAAERGEARAEDHAGINMIGVLHDMIGERTLGFIEQRLYKLAAETL